MKTAIVIKNKKSTFEQEFSRLKVLCERKNIRLTPLRAAVWECLWRAKTPLGAYDIVSMLNEANEKTPPVSVYRILDFWQNNGVVHCLSEENAYVLCAFPDEKHVPVFTVCSVCGAMEEIKTEKLMKELKKNVKKFKIKNAMVRLDGVCANCK